MDELQTLLLNYSKLELANGETDNYDYKHFFFICIHVFI